MHKVRLSNIEKDNKFYNIIQYETEILFSALQLCGRGIKNANA